MLRSARVWSLCLLVFTGCYSLRAGDDRRDVPAVTDRSDVALDAALDAGFDAGAPMDSPMDAQTDAADDLAAPDVSPVDASPCPSLQTLCGAQCVSLRADPAHCGACGVSCAGRFTDGVAACVDGACALVGCAANRSDCDGEATNGCETNVRTSADHCGRCGATCQFPNAAARCENGFCQIDECLVGFADCNGNAIDGCEVNLSRSARNCGRCGTTCLPLGGRAICVGGACGVTTAACSAGAEDCDGESPNGCEVSLLTDVNHCGACGEGCVTPNGRPTCAGGRCGVGECNTGYGDCDGNPSNGCETSVSRSLSHCGACGAVCTFAHGVGACAAGTCRLAACVAGWANCDGNDANGCEVDVTTSGASCGACGAACGAGQLCAMGVCGSSCAAPSSTCGGRCVDLTRDTSHCGACGNACVSGPNATATCSGGRCAVTCAAGYGDCDGVAATGCEVVLDTTAAHCGRCGNACSGGQACVGGVCGCATGQSLCGGACRDIRGDAANCGACGRACAAGEACVDGACPVTATCPDGQTACGTTCRALATDLAHCGACGRACTAGQVCVAGACQTTCPAGQSNCGGACRATGGACTEGVGACARTGVIACAGAGTACSATAGAPGAEVCDGQDNDCNGLTDEGFCRIAGACFSNGGLNPANGCEVCAVPSATVSGPTAWSAATAGVVCRAAAGECDVAETCPGGTAVCPANAARPSGSACTSPVGGVCSLQACGCPAGRSNCVGTCRDLQTDAASCGSCDNACVAGQVCVAGACVVSCPAGQIRCGASCLAAGVACAAGVGACRRTGTQVCVNDTVACSATAGTPSAEVCDNIDNNCNNAIDEGLSRVCYTGPAGTRGVGFCHEGNQTCVAGSWGGTSCPGEVLPAAENCNGVDDDCDGLTDEGFCRIVGTCFTNASRNPANICQVCIVASTTVSGPTSWGNVAAGTVCRASAGVCDPAETCAGTGAACPADVFTPSSAVCRASAGVCDVAESCTGSAAACPANGFSPSTTVCRANNNGGCDVAERCTGSSAACPVDVGVPVYTVCRASTGTCDPEELCLGSSAPCQANTIRPGGSSCDGDAGTCSGDSGTCNCRTGFTLCGGVCVDMSSDRFNCGGCGRRCNVAPMLRCESGSCVE